MVNIDLLYKVQHNTTELKLWRTVHNTLRWRRLLLLLLGVRAHRIKVTLSCQVRGFFANETPFLLEGKGFLRYKLSLAELSRRSVVGDMTLLSTLEANSSFARLKALLASSREGWRLLPDFSLVLFAPLFAIKVRSRMVFRACRWVVPSCGSVTQLGSFVEFYQVGCGESRLSGIERFCESKSCSLACGFGYKFYFVEAPFPKFDSLSGSRKPCCIGKTLESGEQDGILNYEVVLEVHLKSDLSTFQLGNSAGSRRWWAKSDCSTAMASSMSKSYKRIT